MKIGQISLLQRKNLGDYQLDFSVLYYYYYAND